MKRTDEQMRQDALHNLETLIKKRGLNPNVKKYFEEGMIYYSYLTAGGFIGSIDTIDYDARYCWNCSLKASVWQLQYCLRGKRKINENGVRTKRTP